MPRPPEDWRSLLGRKVSIRYLLREDPAHTASEAIGVVQSVGPRDGGEEVVAILSRKGDLVVVPIADVVAARVF